MCLRKVRRGLSILIIGGWVSLAVQPAVAAPLNSCQVGQRAGFGAILGEKPQGMGTGTPIAAGPGYSASMCVFSTKKAAINLQLTTMANSGDAQTAYARIARGDVLPRQTKLNASYGKPVGESIAGTPVTFFPDVKPLGRTAGLMYAQKKNVLLQINMMGKPGGDDNHDLAAKLLAAALKTI